MASADQNQQEDFAEDGLSAPVVAAPAAAADETPACGDEPADQAPWRAGHGEKARRAERQAARRCQRADRPRTNLRKNCRCSRAPRCPCRAAPCTPSSRATNSNRDGFSQHGAHRHRAVGHHRHAHGGLYSLHEHAKLAGPLFRDDRRRPHQQLSPLDQPGTMSEAALMSWGGAGVLRGHDLRLSRLPAPPAAVVAPLHAPRLGNVHRGAQPVAHHRRHDGGQAGPHRPRRATRRS